MVREILARTKSDLIRLSLFLLSFDVVFCLGSFFIGRFTISIFVSVFLGSICSFLNFVFLNVAVYRAMEMGVVDAKSCVRRSYAARYLLLASASILLSQLKFFSFVVFFLPMFIPEFYLLFFALTQKRR